MNVCRNAKHLVLALLAVTCASAWGESVFSDSHNNGDLADAANWTSGVMPGSSTETRLRPDWGKSPKRTEYILSENVTFGKLTVDNITAPSFLDLMQNTFSAGSFLVTGSASPFAFTNGTLVSSAGFTVDTANTKAVIGPGVMLNAQTAVKANAGCGLTIDGSSITSSAIELLSNSTLMTTNSTLTLSGAFILNSDASAVIGPDSTVMMPTSIAKEGLTLNANAKLVIDGGTFNVPTITGDWSLGNRIGGYDNQYNATLEIKNGGAFWSPNAGRNQVTLFHSKLLMSGNSTFDLSNGTNTTYPFVTGDGLCGINVADSTFKFKLWQVGGCSQSTLGCRDGNFNFANSTVGGGTVSGGVAPSDLTFFHASGTPTRNNRFVLDNCTTVVNFKFGGETNRICVIGGTKSGQVILNGTANGLYVTNTTVNATENSIQLMGTDSVIEFSGPQAVLSKVNGNNKVKFASGSNLALRIKDGANAYIGYYGNAEMMSIADDVDGLTISVDDATLTTQGYFDLTAKGAKNVTFEMRGAAPTWIVWYWQTCRQALMTFGRKDSLSDAEAPKIRFVLPQTPYAEAPIRLKESWFTFVLTPTAKIEIDLSECGESMERRTYPLIKGAFRDSVGDPLNAERLAQLTANSNLPKGCRFAYDNSTHTLLLKKSSDAGMTVIIR